MYMCANERTALHGAQHGSGVSMCVTAGLVQSSASSVGFCKKGHNGVMSLLLFWSRRHEGKIAELHLPTLSLFQLMVGQLWSQHRAFSEHHGTHP